MDELSDRPVAAVAEEDGPRVTIALSGDLDAAGAPAARVVVDEALAAGGEEVVFDATDLRFMDSSGIAVLIHAANRTGSVTLVHANDRVRRIVEVTGLAEVIGIQP